MNHRTWGILMYIAGFMVVGAGCSTGDGVKSDAFTDSLREYEQDSAFAFLESFLALGPRQAGSEGGRAAAQWLSDKSGELGWNARIVEWRETTPAGDLEFRNVVARLGRDENSGPFIVLGSHYDTKVLPDIPEFIGANDSGSSTAVLLEIMRVLAVYQDKLPFAVECVFFDGEECYENYTDADGLHGSRRYVEELRNSGRIDHCRAMILLDMVGDAELCLTVPVNSDAKLKRMLFRAADKLGFRRHVANFNGFILDDHVPFLDAGIPAINLIDFNFGPNNSYWHTAADNLNNVSAKSLGVSGRLTLALLGQLEF